MHINRLQRGELYKRLREVHDRLDGAMDVLAEAHNIVGACLVALRDQDMIDSAIGRLPDDKKDELDDYQPPSPL